VSLRFEIEFPDAPAGTASDRTRGRLVARLNGRTLWDLDWTWVELVEHLAHQWRFLVYEESAPGPFNPYEPDVLSHEARRFFEENPSDEDENAFEAFVESHDLSRALKGAWPRRVWLMRCGYRMLVWSSIAESLLPLQDVLMELESLAETVCARLDGAADARSLHASAAWARRADVTDMDRVAIATGLPLESLTEAAGTADPLEFWQEPTAGSHELVAVARMTAWSLDRSTLGSVLRAIRTEARRSTPVLDALARQAAVAADPADAPHVEGYRAAAFVRRHLNVVGKLDVARLLADWNVAFRPMVMPAAIDAICAWGHAHGPVILTNPQGLHAGTPRGLRTTLAHELCHLLLDRDGALPVAEVLGGSLPPRVERRARAFAAELLLPQEAARAASEAKLDSGIDIEDVVAALVDEYDVSLEVAAWQIRNSGADLTTLDRRYLQRLVSDPRRF
jgi:hypothetical protein